MEHRARITFECGHNRDFPSPPPKVGEILWCVSCRKEVRVMHAPDDWRIRCTNCIYSRNFGAAQLNSEISAAKHRLKHPEHVVKIFNGNRLAKTFGVPRNQTVIELSPDRDPGCPF